MSLGFDNFLQLVQTQQQENFVRKKQQMQKEDRNQQDEIDRILKDPKKYRKMMLIMQQTLYDFGYHESAKMLQSESGINYYSSELLEIKQLLQKNDFQAAIKVIQQLQKNALQYDGIKQQQKNGSNTKTSSIRLGLPTLAQTKMMIYETYCMHNIINKDFEAAMTIISQNIKNQAKKQFLCQALVLGNHHLSKQQLEKKKQGIYKYCLSSWQQIGEKEIQKVIQSYREHEGEFNKQVKGLFSEQKLQPPMRIWSVELQKQIKHTITHMRISLALNSIYLVQEDRDVLTLHLISIDNKKLQYMKHCMESVYGDNNKRQSILSKRISKTLQVKYKGKRQSIESICVNPNPEYSNIKLAVCSFNVITILSADLEVLSKIESSNKIQKYLHIDFHPVSELLYTCGYFETLNAIDSQGQLVQSVYPFPKTRKFLFSDNNHTIGISLVTNKVYKHSLDEQTLVKQIQLDDSVVPMDICISDKDSLIGLSKQKRTQKSSFKQNTSQFVAVSSLQFIYILDSDSLNILGKTTSPTNPNKLIVQVKFYHHYLISLAKNFTAYTIENDVVNKQEKMRDQNEHNNSNHNKNGNFQLVSISKNREWIGEGTFCIEDNFMMSGYKEVIIWVSGEPQQQMIDQSLQSGLNDNMEEEIPLLSDDEQLLSESSLDSNDIEEDQNSQQENQEEQQSEEQYI